MDRYSQQQLYLKVLELHYKAKIGHIGPSLSCVDLVSTLFSKVMRSEDRFILSKGHAVTSLIATLNLMGELSDKEVATFNSEGTTLAMHPTPQLMKYCAFPTGSLGHGLSQAAGMAQAMDWHKKDGEVVPKVYCLMSDGECNVGQVWEAAAYISGKGIKNVLVIIDRNGWQAFGRTSEVLGDGASEARWQAFGFETLVIDGHRSEEIEEGINKLSRVRNEKPKVLIANTKKGHGISYMEDTLESHYWPMSDEQYAQAVSDIKKTFK